MLSRRNSQANTTSQISAGSLLPPPMACSPDIPPQLVDYLQLTPLEVRSVQEQVLEACRKVEPLVDQLEKSRRQLMSMELNGTAGGKDIQALAAEQSKIMQQLIVMNSQLESKLYSLLNTEQQRKINGLIRQALAAGDKLSLAQ